MGPRAGLRRTIGSGEWPLRTPRSDAGPGAAPHATSPGTSFDRRAEGSARRLSRRVAPVTLEWGPAKAPGAGTRPERGYGIRAPGAVALGTLRPSTP